MIQSDRKCVNANAFVYPCLWCVLVPVSLRLPDNKSYRDATEAAEHWLAWNMHRFFPIFIAALLIGPPQLPPILTRGVTTTAFALAHEHGDSRSSHVKAWHRAVVVTRLETESLCVHGRRCLEALMSTICSVRRFHSHAEISIMVINPNHETLILNPKPETQNLNP